MNRVLGPKFRLKSGAIAVGSLAVSRAFGDFGYKQVTGIDIEKQPVTPTAEVQAWARGIISPYPNPNLNHHPNPNPIP